MNTHCHPPFSLVFDQNILPLYDEVLELACKTTLSINNAPRHSHKQDESKESMCDCLLPRLVLWGNGRHQDLTITPGIR